MSLLKFVATAALTGALCAVAMAQTATPGIQLVDATGRFAGNLIGQDKIVLRFANGEALLGFSNTGYAEDSWNPRVPALLYETADCSGATYALANSVPALGLFRPDSALPAAGTTRSGTVYYATRPYKKITARSALYLIFGIGECRPDNQTDITVSSLGSAPVSSFKLPLSFK